MSFFFLLFLLLFASCDDLEDTDTPSGGDDGMPVETGTAELYILSEGLFNLNNSSLALYSFKNNQLNTDYFRSINRRGLGDTANDMGIYGSKLYIVVNVSSQIEVVDLQSGKSSRYPCCQKTEVPGNPATSLSTEARHTCVPSTEQWRE